VIGDEKYGAKTDPTNRLGLHACSLRFRHPVTGEDLRFTSPLPKPLARLI
jgi:23S rRNA pseudouridine1911/1915/1917 synthase